MFNGFKNKYYAGAPSLRRLIEGRKSKFSDSSIMRKIATLSLMLYMWPVKKAFNEENNFFDNLGKRRKCYIDVASSLTDEQRNYYRTLQDLVHVYNHGEYNLIRIGAEHDGGYIMLDDFAPVSNSRGGVSVI